jgi:OHCU decarboxylase
MTNQPRLTLTHVNSLDRASFVAALGSLFEGTPAIVEQTWDARPFESFDALHTALIATMRALPFDAQIALIRAHPDLAGRAAIAGELTPESTREQASARLDQLSEAEFTRFHQLNTAYREQFGFPFVICVREQTRTTILASFEQRLGNQRAAEVATALTEIAKIAGLRMRDLLS